MRGTGQQVADHSGPLDLARPERPVGHQIQVEVEVQIVGHCFQQVDGQAKTAVRVGRRPVQKKNGHVSDGRQRDSRKKLAIRSHFLFAPNTVSLSTIVMLSLLVVVI